MSDLGIDFDYFIYAKVGKCRHHALLNAYLLSRLVNDGMLQGQVIFHGQWMDIQNNNEIQNVGHAFNMFIDEKAGVVYFLDSLLGSFFSISQNANNPLFKLYRCNSIDDTIRTRLLQFEQDKNIHNILNHVFSLPKAYAAAAKNRINRQRFQSLILLSEEAYRVYEEYKIAVSRKIAELVSQGEYNEKKFEKIQSEAKEVFFHNLKTVINQITDSKAESGGLEQRFMDTHEGKTPLYIALEKGDIELAKLLVPGGKVSAYKKDGKTALMIAAEIGNSYTVMELLNEGAKINLKDKQGNTALMLAIMENRNDVVNILLKKGANFFEKNIDGVSVLDLASKQMGWKDVTKTSVFVGKVFNNECVDYDFKGCDLSQARFEKDIDLTTADFRGANIRTTCFKNALLVKNNPSKTDDTAASATFFSKDVSPKSICSELNMLYIQIKNHPQEKQLREAARTNLIHITRELPQETRNKVLNMAKEHVAFSTQRTIIGKMCCVFFGLDQTKSQQVLSLAAEAA